MDNFSKIRKRQKYFNVNKICMLPCCFIEIIQLTWNRDRQISPSRLIMPRYCGEAQIPTRSASNFIFDSRAFAVSLPVAISSSAWPGYPLALACYWAVVYFGLIITSGANDLAMRSWWTRERERERERKLCRGWRCAIVYGNPIYLLNFV